ncbi:MAG TPA: hypothetical protein VGL35_09460 [Rhizomicrobium sp.]|jgi:hypothetical protein
MQHIREAHELSRELGGTDQDVKAYFFSLPSDQLKYVLDLYQQEHGLQAREYAELTIPKWRTSSVKMSGQTAERLFNLLPPLMPLQAKYQLTENLWKHVGPKSKRRLRIGLDANLESVLEAIRTHIAEVVIRYQIPEQLERRFEWLSAGDVSVKQDLLNHVRNVERALVVESAKVHLPVLLRHLSSAEGSYTTRAAQILAVGKHELEVLIDKAASGVALEEWSPVSLRGGRSGISNVTLFWLAFFVVLALIWVASR